MFSWATDDSQLLQYVYLFMVKMFCVKGISYTSTPKKRQTQPSIDSHTVSSTNTVGQPPAEQLSTSSAVAEDVQPAIVLAELVSELQRDLPLSGEMLISTLYSSSENPFLLVPVCVPDDTPSQQNQESILSQSTEDNINIPSQSFIALTPDPGMQETKNKLHQKRSAMKGSSMHSGVVTRSGKQRQNTLPLSQNSSKATKKKQKTSVSPVRNFVNIPSGSEDSALSCSDENDELDIHVTAAMTKQKCNERLSSKWSQAEKVQKRMTWKDGAMLLDEEKTKFMGNTELGEDLQQQLSTPLQFFKYFFTDQILCFIAEQTTLYSVQQCPENPFKATKVDIERFIGVSMFMSLIKLSSCRYYWSSQFRISQVADIMTYKNFVKIKRFFFCKQC